MKSNDEPEHQAKKKGVSKKMLGLKNIWKNMFFRKKEKIMDMEETVLQDHCCATRTFPITIKKDNAVLNDTDVDIMEKDKDRIRTSCKSSLQEIPEFPSKDEVRKRIEDAHKYYGIKCVYNYYVAVENSDKKQEPLPSWYYILERPLVEQYVLMNNYIRKLSILSSMKSETEGCEFDALEDTEEVSSISSHSDYSDFPKDSGLIELYKKSKRERVDTDDDYRRSLTTADKNCETRQDNKSGISTVTTKDYKIIMRGPKWFDDIEEDRDESNSNVAEGNTAGPSNQEGEEPSNDQLDTMKNVAMSSGDHLPDMKDFDLSYNLSECTTITSPRPGQSYYHWRGNSCPTKTPLLNTNTRPSRRRGPHSSMDFWSYRNFSLSPEFIEMWDECENRPEDQELRIQALKLEYESQRALLPAKVAGEDIERNDEENTIISNVPQPVLATMSRRNYDEQSELSSVSQINLNEDSDRGETDGSCTSSLASVDTKIPANPEQRNAD